MERDRGVIEVLNELVARRPRWGFWKLYDRLRLDGQCINHKRLHRVYCAMKLNLPRRTKRRLPTRIRQPLVAPAGLNQIWALDFMADALYGGRAFRTLNLIDEGNRQVRGIEAQFIQPGKLDQNAFIERFNKTYRDEVLDAYVFETVEQVREITETWLHEYNEERPHDSLGRVPPLMFMPRPLTALESSFKLCPWRGSLRSHSKDFSDTSAPRTFVVTAIIFPSTLSSAQQMHLPQKHSA